MGLTDEIRKEVRERAQHRAKFRKHEASAEEIQKALDQERKLRDRLLKNAKVLRLELGREVDRDPAGKGEHSEEWEDRAADRLDEFAEETEAVEAEIDAMMERITDHRDLKDQLRKNIDEDEARIDRLQDRRRRRRKEKSDQLTKDFHLAEFDCRNGATVKGNCPAIIDDLEDLCKRHLQPLRDSGGVVAINSGFRTAAYNASIGGASNSYHIYTVRSKAPAVDHVQGGRSPSGVAAWHDSHDAFDGMGRYSSFVHGDDRGYSSRWTG